MALGGDCTVLADDGNIGSGVLSLTDAEGFHRDDANGMFTDVEVC